MEHNMKINKALIKDNIIKIFKDKKKRLIACGAAGAILIILIVMIVVLSLANKEEVVYRETTVVRGNLTVGVEIDGTVSVGTTTQTLDVDISAYTSSDSLTFENMSGIGSGGSSGKSSSSGISMSGGMPSAGGMPSVSGLTSGGGMSSVSGGSSSGGTGGASVSFAGTSNTASGTRTLEVEAVYVSVGQKISAGDPIVKLSEDSVNEIRSKLEEDVTSAEVTYRKQATEAELADLSADQTLETNQKYSSYATTEYNQTVSSLQTSVDTAQENLDDAKESLATLQSDLAEYQALLPEYQTLLDNANYTVNSINVRENVYGWTTAENAREKAQTMYDNLVDSIESTESSIAAQESYVSQYESNLATAKYNLKTGTIEAKAKYDKAMLNSSNADSIYEVSKGKTALSNEIALDEYNEAKEKLDEFNSHIDGQTVTAQYDGVVTEVMVATGDYIGTGTELVTINDYDEVTITVSVEEDDVENAQLGCKANIYVPAMPDEVFTAEVTEVGDATYDSSSATTYYDVTVTLSGNTTALYSGMNAEVTFITKESAEVLYVSNRAIIRENGQSKVKIKDSKGNIVTRKIETGFSDGNNVEIKSGLEEGDVVLIESKVSD